MESEMNTQRISRLSSGSGRRGVSLLLGAALTTLAVAQETQKHGLVTFEPKNLADLAAPKSEGPKTVEYSMRFGVKDVQGQARLYGKAGIEMAGSSDGEDVFKKDAVGRNEPDTARKVAALGGLAADINFFGAMREVAALEIKAEAPIALRAHPEIKKVVRVCGFTIELADEGRSRSNAIASEAEAQKLGPKELLPGGIVTQVMVGPVPLLIRANGGVGVELGAAPFFEQGAASSQPGEGGQSGDQGNAAACCNRSGNKPDSDHPKAPPPQPNVPPPQPNAPPPISTRLGVDGTAGLYLNGWVVAGVGGGCRFGSACAGVKGDLRLMDTTFDLRLGYGTQEGLLAKLGFEIKTLVARLSAIAYVELRVGRFKIGRTFEQLLLEWSAKPITGTIGS
jgi:hypothetical protein